MNGVLKVVRLYHLVIRRATPRAFDDNVGKTALFHKRVQVRLGELGRVPLRQVVLAFVESLATASLPAPLRTDPTVVSDEAGGAVGHTYSTMFSSNATSRRCGVADIADLRLFGSVSETSFYAKCLQHEWNPTSN